MDDNNKIIEVKNELIESEIKYLTDIKNGEIRLKDIPKKIRTYEICIEAVKQHGSNLKDVPEDLKTEEICLEAIKHIGYMVNYIPKDLQNKKFYAKVLKIFPAALRDIPKKYISEKMINDAIECDGIVLEFLEEKEKTKNICKMALESNPLALEFVPKKYIDKGLCEELLEKNVRVFTFIPDKYKDKEVYMNVLNNLIKENLSEYEIRKIVDSFPDTIHKDEKAIKLERILGIRKFIIKKYAKLRKNFITIEEISYCEENEIKEFEEFVDFYEHIEGNLNNADLYDYDFEGIDLKNFNIEGAYMNSKILVKQNVYDNEYYFNTIGKDLQEITKYNQGNKNEIIKPENILHQIDNVYSFNNDYKKIYYISDIHLCHKILKKFPKHATKIEIYKYVEKIIENMISTASNNRNDYLLVGGDVSTKFEISEMFYTILRKKWNGYIIAILGNHEVWNIDNEMQCDNLDEIFNKYQELFNKLDIVFLQNDLLFEYRNGLFPKLKKITEKELQRYSTEEIKKMSMESRMTILGGLGFSGLNKEYNASTGLYRNTITTVEKDEIESNKFKNLYNKVLNAMNKDKVIVFTHTPKDNWTEEMYNSKWIYLNGHTHINTFCCNDEKTVYSDNQIGYYNTSIGLKHFELVDQFDYFKYYTDGIYTISREQYILFNRGINVPNMQFNKVAGKIYMLKKNNIYCFLYENEKEKLYLLAGGKTLNIEIQDVSYYYDRIDIFSNIAKNAVAAYNYVLKHISNEVKSFGGNGTIHGCIVDIDFTNHLYVNPFDGTITPYFALSMEDKLMYNNLNDLLSTHRMDLYSNYLKLLKDKNSNIKLLSNCKKKKEGLTISHYMSETFMYTPSKQMKTIQYLIEMNVIRFWNDEIINKYVNENGNIENNNIQDKSKKELPV